MEYVMVPVPEELVVEAKQFVVGLEMRAAAHRAGADFDPEAADRMMAALNPRCRTALSLVAAASAARKHLSVRDLAATTGWTEHETSGVIAELSELVWVALGPVITVVQSEFAAVDSESVDWGSRVVVVGKEFAIAVVAADGAAAGRA